MFPAVETLVLTIKAMVFLVETTVGVTQTFFSEAEPIFYASETGFSITKKTLGEMPASCQRMSFTLLCRTIFESTHLIACDKGISVVNPNP